MAKARITYLSQAEKEFVHEKTLEVLEKVGVAYNTPQAIDLLEAAGARVDREALTARLTWDAHRTGAQDRPADGAPRRARSLLGTSSSAAGVW